MSIAYQKCGIDDDVLRLLRKLVDVPTSSLILDIENFWLTPNKVFYDGKLYGLLILQGQKNRRGQKVLVVFHAIAEDGIEEHFTAILAESLQAHAKAAGFELIRIHADKLSMARIMSRYGQPNEWVFTIGVSQCLQTNQVAHRHSKLHLQQPTLE